MASNENSSSGAQAGSDIINTTKSTMIPLPAQSVAAVVVDEGILTSVVGGQYTLHDAQPGPYGLRWTSKITHSAQPNFIIAAKSLISLSVSPCEWQRVICATYDAHRRHYELVVACGTGYKSHPITAVRQIKREADLPLGSEETEMYEGACRCWTRDTVAKIAAERKIQDNSIPPAAVVEEISPTASTAAPSSTASEHKARARLPRKSKDKPATKMYFFI